MTSYCFRVLATNAAGTTAPGPASEAFTTAAGPPDPPAGPLWIGQEAPGALGRGFAGLLDDVRVYGDRALSDGEVQRLHARLRHCSG